MNQLITFGLQVVIAAVYFTLGHYIGWYKGFKTGAGTISEKLGP